MFRTMLRDYILSRKSLRKPSVRICSEHLCLPALFTSYSSNDLRSMLMLPVSNSSTQLNQDVFALLINRFKPGYFLEIGANDGITLSNTLYLEENFGWSGLLVEANPFYEQKLCQRNAISVIAAVADREGVCEFKSAGLFGGIIDTLDDGYKKYQKEDNNIIVQTLPMSRILSDNNAPSRIDFISIDVEGAEPGIVRQLCSLEQYRFTCGCIEHNHRRDDYSSIESNLLSANYSIIWKDQTGHDLFFVDRSIRWD